MRTKWMYSELLVVLFSLWSCILFGQDTLQNIHPFVNNKLQNKQQNRYLKATACIIPGAFLMYGALKPVVSGIQYLDGRIMQDIRKNNPKFHTRADDYLMWAPSASVYFMDACSIQTKHTFKEHFIIDASSIILTGSIGYLMRKITGEIKTYTPQGTDFPSGHTANAFRGAEIFYQEVKDKNKLLSYSGYFIATTVGVLRIYNKTHLLTQVTAGAGLGIFSTKIIYWLFDKTKYRKK